MASSRWTLSRTSTGTGADTPRRGITSFENLVALANYQEALRDARRMVWRDRGEPAAELQTLWECLNHAGKGGLRSAILGFTLRSGFNVFVLLFRIWKTPRHFRFSLIRRAVLGEDSFRFAAMLGAFVSLYKFVLNASPIVFPSSRSQSGSPLDSEPTSPEVDLPIAIAPTRSERRRGRLSFRAQVHDQWVRKKTRRWHALLAGAVSGGLGVMFEKKGRRIVISQQLFVRGLQGCYNDYSNKHGFHIPHGEIIVFSLACAHIMYAFLMQPEANTPSYNKWIQQASLLPAEAVRMNRTIARNGVFDPNDALVLINHKRITSSNRQILTNLLSAAETGELTDRYAPCAAIHPWLDNCTVGPFDKFFAVAKWMFPIYGALHFIPMLLFKRGTVFKYPIRMMIKALWGTMRSSAFLGMFVVICQTGHCMKHNLHHFLTSLPSSSPFKFPQKIVDVLISKFSFWILGLLTGFSLLMEEKRRRGELAMYVLPKGLESAWNLARGRGYVWGRMKYGEVILCAAGMGMVMSTYQNDPQHLSGIVRRILYQFIGPN